MSHLDEGRLHALLDGELQGSERSEAEAHLAGCADCRAALEEARALFQETDRLIAAVDLPAAPAAAPQVAPPRSARRITSWQRMAWAATVVLAVGLGWFARSGVQTSSDGADETAFGNAAAAPATMAESAGAPAAMEQRRAPAEPPAEAGPTAQPAPAPTQRRLDESKALDKSKEKEPEAPPSKPAETGKLAQKVADSAAALSLEESSVSVDRAAAPKAERQDAFGNAASTPAPAPTAAAPTPAPASRDSRVSGLVPAPARARRENPGAYRPVAMEEAVRILGGSIRLVDGLDPVRVLASEANPGQVRVVYDDPPGRELWLDQERRETEADRPLAAGERSTALLPGDTVATTLGEGARSLRWMDQSGFRLGLTGFLPADSLRGLARRVQ